MIKKFIAILFIFTMVFSAFGNNVILASEAEGTTASGKDSRTESSSTTKASSSKGSTGDSIISGANGFIEQGEKEIYGYKDDEGNEHAPILNKDELAETSNNIYNILLAIAMVVAVAVGVTLGIKFMISSVEEQAKIKELLVAYVAGCIVVFGAMGIWKLAVTTFSKL